MAKPAAYGSSGLGAELDLQPPAYITATAGLDMSHMCDLPKLVAMPDP